MRYETARLRKQGAGHRPEPGPRLRAILCGTAQGELLDACMLMIGRETDVVHVPTLAEAMERCLKGRTDILFVNMLPIHSRELTALSLFRGMARGLWIVALAPEDLRPALLAAGIADEVVSPGPISRRSFQPRA